MEQTRPRVLIGKYEIVALLGRGGMGAVHKAFDPLLQREVAIKVMLPGIADDPEQKQRFEREARAVARLTHPSIVTVFDLGYHTDGSPYIVMELLRGRDLLEVLRQGLPLSLDQKIAIILQVLGGLGHAHQAGIVHRDIKPANVFIAEDGVAKIMDFGVARVASSAATGTGSVVGTTSYMSPEQVRGEKVDGRSDLFSVGTLLCELFTGRRPFEGETAVAILYRIAHEEPRIELPSGPQYERLRPVLTRALARNANERYATAAEFAAALRACLGRQVAPTPDSPRRDEGKGVAAGVPALDTAVPRPATVAPTPAVESPTTGERRADPSGIFRLLREIYVGERTGYLHFGMGKERKGLRILKGRILSGTSDAAGEHLGDVLVRYGLLSQIDLERAVEVVLRERKRLGAVLSDLGLIERPALEEAVGIHCREILFSALDRSDVTFSFEDAAESSLATDLVCPHSMGQVILEAARRVSDFDLVRRVLGDTSRVLTLSNNPLLRSQNMTLTPTDGFLLSRIDGTLSARDVVGLVPLAVEDAERGLFALLCTGIVGYRSEAKTRQRTAGTPARHTPPPDPSTPPILHSTRPSPSRTRIDSTPSRPTTTPLSASGPRPFSPGPPTPTPNGVLDAAEIRRAILEVTANPKWDHFELLGVGRSATEADIRNAYLHFARILHPDAAMDPSLADLREQRQAFFIRLCEAYETLRSPASRARYEQAFDASPSTRRRSTTPHGPTAAALRELEPRTTTPPPEAPPPGSDAAGAGRPTDLLGHEVWVAEQNFKAEKYWDVIQQLEPLIPRVEGATRIQAQMLLSQAYMKNPLWAKRAEAVLLTLVREAPEHCPAHLLLARLYGRRGLVTRARASYMRVLTIQPENETATRELAALEAPMETHPPGGLRGFFTKR